MDHIRFGLTLITRPGLNVEVNAVNAIICFPGGDLHSHRLRLLLRGQPVPGVWLVTVGVPEVRDQGDEKSALRLALTLR